MEKYWDGENWLEIFKTNYLIEFYLNGLKHRKDGPSRTWYFEKNLIGFKQYHENGKLHRKNAPAQFEHDENGNIEAEKYYQNGKLHRKDGPANIRYYFNGNIKIKKYYYNNIEFDPNKLSFEMPIDTEKKNYI